MPFPLGLLQGLNKIVCVKPQAQCQATVTVHFPEAVVGMAEARVSMAGFWNLHWSCSLSLRLHGIKGG